ncbi:MAG: ZIP family metal transporter [Gammaproteobacteria bacterium]|nr:ZIP family metal transporter [Gammaproteobacteria bacterium]
MNLLVLVVAFCLLGGVLSVIAAGSFLVMPERLRTPALPHFVSFAIGALLGAAFLAILPHALEAPGVDTHDLLGTVLLGLLAFFLLEKLVLWRHCHHDVCEPGHEHHQSVPGVLILVGDAIHNFVDGVLIAAAFLTDVHLGIVTAIAVAAHEIPQEVGDFAILLQSGFSRAKAFAYNVLASASTVVGGLLAYFALSDVQSVVPYVLAIAASSFIYIAVADLIPGLHRRVNVGATVQQAALIAAGVIIIYFSHSTLH